MSIISGRWKSKENDVNLKQVKASGIILVGHKASQGAAGLDDRYHARQLEARSLGLGWVAYHFGTAENVTEDDLKKMFAFKPKVA